VVGPYIYGLREEGKKKVGLKLNLKLQTKKLGRTPIAIAQKLAH